MNLHFLDKKVFFGNSDAVSSLHYNLFHGEIRFGEPDSKTDCTISRSGNDVPPVFMPELDLVVREDIVKRLHLEKFADCVPVRFDRLYHCDLQKGDFSFYETYVSEEKAGSRETRYFQSLSNVPEYHKNVSQYFLIVLPVYNKLCKSHPELLRNATNITIDPDGEHVDEPISLEVTPSFLEKFPMFWWDGVWMPESIFDHLLPHLDADLFYWRFFS